MTQEKLIRFIKGTSGSKEQREVLDWIQASKENSKIFAQLKNIHTAVDLYAAERQPAETSIPKKSAPLKPIWVWSARVAAILILAVSVFFIGQHSEKDKWLKASAEQITEVKVPYGESVTLVLPDSSVVKLNSGSVLKFSKLFGQTNRNLTLDGEGHFQVQKDPEKQFVVSTADVDIQVIGTTFNISAYSEDRIITTSLYEGKLRVFNTTLQEYAILHPDESYVYDRVAKKSKTRTENPAHNWTENYFVANSDDIDVFVRKIERKYNVRIIVDPQLIGTCRYTGVFRGESLTEILQNMAVASPIQYQIEKDDTIRISGITK